MILVASCDGGNNDPSKKDDPKADLEFSQSFKALFNEGYSASEGEDGFDIEFTAGGAWTISAEETKAPASWISFNPSSGKAGPAKVTAAIAANTSESERTAVIKLSSGKTVMSISVKQAAPPSNPAVKASYDDFIGEWIVTGTEHRYFADWDDRTEVYTFSYAIQVIEDVKGKSYLIENWETGATAEDRKYLYYGCQEHADKTQGYSIYDYYLNVVKKYIGLSAWYDEENGTMHVDRQTFYTDPYSSSYTVEFLGSSQLRSGEERPIPRGSFAADLKNETEKKEYTVCDFVKLKDGSVRIQAHPQTDDSFADSDIVFMGYCQYYGWYPNPKYYNSQFALPYSMVKAPAN